LGWAMERLGDALAGLLSFVRESGAPAFAALWALAAFVVAAVLIRRRQDTFGWKVGASLLVFGGAAGTLLWWSAQSGPQYYKHVDEVQASSERFRLRRTRLQMLGCVVPGSIERRAGGDDYRFDVENITGRTRAVMRARYTGWVPDAFRGGAEIVVMGRLAADGTLDVAPDGIMTRCPSKYDPGAGPTSSCERP
jgi:cytochrome c-type biogenesis protein CcmE